MISSYIFSLASMQIYLPLAFNSSVKRFLSFLLPVSRAVKSIDPFAKTVSEVGEPRKQWLRNTFGIPRIIAFLLLCYIFI